MTTRCSTRWGTVSNSFYLVYDVVKELPKGVKAALYADDLVIWCTEEYAATATYRMQIALDKLSAWTDKWCLQINKEKSATTLFTLTAQKAGKLTLGNEPLQETDEQTYLGVTFDKRQTWKTQVGKAESKARKKLGMMRKLAGTEWGANEKILKQVYQGTVRPTLEYGSGAYMSASKSHLNSLEKVQNQALRVITGAMRSTPIEKMQTITGIAPLQKRMESKAMIMLTKAKAMKDHPMHDRAHTCGPSRLKRTSFVRQAKTLHEKFKDQLPPDIEPIQTIERAYDWKDDPGRYKVSTKVPGLNMKGETSKGNQRLTSLEMIQDRFPQEAWTHVYTDGSASDAVRNGGAGVYIQYQHGNSKSIAEPTGEHCTNYKAEVEALIIAANEISKDVGSGMLNNMEPDAQVVLLTDALSVLQALDKGKLPHLHSALSNMNCLRVVLQWIPAHCGIPGNEEADKQAKSGAEMEQPETRATFKEMKTTIKSLHRPNLQQDGYCGLTRNEQVKIFRMRTGHSRLNQHMFARFRIGESSRCPCGEPSQTAEHILQHCPNYANLRKQMWPTPIVFADKIYGPTEALRTTAEFMIQTGLAL